MTMQTANCLIAIGGDSGNTVPKYGVTVAEIAVLRAIHGDDAVTDIQPVAQIERTHRMERQRLIEKYGRQEDGKFSAPAVESLFPGVAARVFETFAEAEIDPSFFKAIGRVSMEAVDPLFPEEHGSPAPAAEATEEPDGIGDMPPARAAGEPNLFA